MFVPVTKREREEFLNQNNAKFIPGYTGHCPELKYCHGKSYGAETKRILKDLREKGVVHEALRFSYINRQPIEIDRLPSVSIDAVPPWRHGSVIGNRASRYIVGYTGFVPMLNYCYGKSYSRTAEECMSKFTERWQRRRKSASETETKASRPEPKLIPIRGKDDVAEMLRRRDDEFLIKVDDGSAKSRKISADCPPIAGYTGHVPRARTATETLALRYRDVVKSGLTLVNEERRKRNRLFDTQKRIASIVRDAKGRYSVEEI